MTAGNALQDVTITVGESARALAFYRDLLGFRLVEQIESGDRDGSSTLVFDVGNGHRLRLRSYAGQAQPSTWLPNDLQVGYRHIGFGVQDTDRTVARLKASGVQFRLDPLDATGDVRIAFFEDPDGTLLEVVQGNVKYHRTGTAALPPRSDLPQSSGQGELIFDHIAISVSDLDKALGYYRDTLGFPLLGQLFFHDARGFAITYLRAGLGVLELFSYSSPTIARTEETPETALGIRRIGFAVEDLAPLTSKMDAATITPVDDHPSMVGGSPRMQGADADGNPIEFFRTS